MYKYHITLLISVLRCVLRLYFMTVGHRMYEWQAKCSVYNLHSSSHVTRLCIRYKTIKPVIHNIISLHSQEANAGLYNVHIFSVTLTFRQLRYKALVIQSESVSIHQAIIRAFAEKSQIIYPTKNS